MNKLLSMAAATVMVSVAVASSAFATYDFGQLGSGDIYHVRNVSDNQSSFEKTTNADLCETVQFKVRVHNAGPKTLTNVNVKATLPSGASTTHTSTASITADNNRDNAVATGSASVTLSKAGTISYVNGSTQLLDTNGGVMRTLGDTILTSGVNIGSVDVSLNNVRYVQFNAKTNCEAPVVKNITVCELATKNIITIDEKAYDASKHSKDLADCAPKPPVVGEIVVCEMATKNVVTIKENAFDSSKHTKDLSKCAEAVVATQVTPTQLPQTGASGVIGIVASVIAAAAGYVVTARKNVLG